MRLPATTLGEEAEKGNRAIHDYFFVGHKESSRYLVRSWSSNQFSGCRSSGEDGELLMRDQANPRPIDGLGWLGIALESLTGAYGMRAIEEMPKNPLGFQVKIAKGNQKRVPR